MLKLFIIAVVGTVAFGTGGRQPLTKEQWESNAELISGIDKGADLYNEGNSENGFR